ncbi:hypothetical protein [Maribacter sp. 2210JD10-5]|uniref:hypothetical protein n=1 Tax=Maribacter sp. 2210JD10-5 TaxID=3386272 RepID=UPI0039BCFABB
MRFNGFFLVILMMSCSSDVSKEDLSLLNGYWEIERVTFPDGNEKEYKANLNIDFIKIDSLTGYRKKVNPKFNGSFETSDDAELFNIIQEEDIFFIHYKNNLSEWKEELLTLSQREFSIKNEANVIYHYKRYEPINLNP